MWEYDLSVMQSSTVVISGSQINESDNFIHFGEYKESILSASCSIETIWS